ncbi:ImmA/IrrE family metallo-endopeptidase [Streptacidiphilus sp. MAP5-52]|uniref:ImmA/IrrE family metallo-endopeptidase n=1 Tax=Streptacidiphilus sp. MAP5-52 TaxID=3156267 RepID=UPI003515838C
MDEKSLRAYCEERLGLLHLPHRFTHDQLISAAEDFIGLPIVRTPKDMRGQGVYGKRTRHPDREEIEYEENTSPLHQLQIIAHEIAHIILGHKGLEELAAVQSDEELAAQMDWSVIGISHRTSYDTDEEQEAEMMGTVIRNRVYRNRELPPLQPSAADERWEAAFTRPIKERRT